MKTLTAAASTFALAMGLSPLRVADAFLATLKPTKTFWSLSLSLPSDLPSLAELSKDPFMKQVSHASMIVPLLDKDPPEDSELAERLAAQFSHSDGIRGFFVTYLTTREQESPADKKQVPKALAYAMLKANQQDLVPLACMNVIMPTAMTTMHTDAALAESSRMTAQRAKTIIKALKDNPAISENCDAIVAATGSESTTATSNDDLVNYWKKFFKSYGYGPEQTKDISKAFVDLCA